MKFIFTTILLLTSSLTFAGKFDLFCFANVCSISPYPGAGGCTQVEFRGDLIKNTAGFEDRDGYQFINLDSVQRYPKSGKVSILGTTKDGQDVDFILGVLGNRGPYLKGTIGNKKVDFECNKSLRINL